MLTYDIKMDIFIAVLIMAPVLLMVIPSLAKRIIDAHVKFNKGRKVLLWLFPVSLYIIFFATAANNLVTLLVFSVVMINFTFMYSAAISALIILMQQGESSQTLK
jgi:hypothetical protein